MSHNHRIGLLLVYFFGTMLSHNILQVLSIDSGNASGTILKYLSAYNMMKVLINDFGNYFISCQWNIRSM
jgi:hypothetical protein